MQSAPPYKQPVTFQLPVQQQTCHLHSIRGSLGSGSSFTCRGCCRTDALPKMLVWAVRLLECCAWSTLIYSVGHAAYFCYRPCSWHGARRQPSGDAYSRALKDEPSSADHSGPSACTVVVADGAAQCCLCDMVFQQAAKEGPVEAFLPDFEAKTICCS